jgi:uncharacterized membrane protein YwaF
MDWTAAIDIYCERTSTGFWAEPLNAWSNLAFPAAALCAAVLAHRRGGATPAYWGLVILAALVGVGSFLFHTFANVWSEYADTIPIWTFVAATLFVAASRVAGRRPNPGVAAALVVAVVLIVTYVTATDPTASSPPAPLNGSLQYAPALIALAAFAVLARHRRAAFAPLMLGATAAFLAALLFRTIALATCAAVPFGMHFLWHLLNGLTVRLILVAMRAAEAKQTLPGTAAQWITHK